jgi:nucleoside 2-deoxyribosyltransferase
MKLYLAGPDVFYPNVKDIAKAKKEICAKYGATGLFPLDNKIDITKKGADLKIYIANCALMVEADACIANLTPFRGPSMDVGTAFEVGYMTALGKKVYGYTNNGNNYYTRVCDDEVYGYIGSGNTDVSGHIIEDFGNVDNLMIDRAIVCGTQVGIAKPCETAPGTNLPLSLRNDDLTMFELAVKWATQKG